MKIILPNCQDCKTDKDCCKAVYFNDDLYCINGINGEPYKTTSDFEAYRIMVSNKEASE